MLVIILKTPLNNLKAIINKIIATIIVIIPAGVDKFKDKNPDMTLIKKNVFIKLSKSNK